MSNYSEVEAEVKYTQGKILTVLDASFAFKKQGDSVKSLVNMEISKLLTTLKSIFEEDTK